MLPYVAKAADTLEIVRALAVVCVRVAGDTFILVSVSRRGRGSVVDVTHGA
jgi:hypothetical protein